MPSCFVIMPISTPIDLVPDYLNDHDHFEHVLDYLFKPALERAGYDLIPPSVINSQIIQAEIIRNLETADLVLCDISGWNANVFFELGIRVALDQPVALVKDNKTLAIPFDNALISCHTYDASIAPWQLDAEIQGIAEVVQSAGEQNRNALWRFFGITQRASVPAAGDPVQEKLDLILASLQQIGSPLTGTLDASLLLSTKKTRRQLVEAWRIKEELVSEAESLAESSEWGPTASRFRILMTEWKAAGRSPKEIDESLWSEFRTAQDRFFRRRSAHFSEGDVEPG